LQIPERWSPVSILSDGLWELSFQQINANIDEKVSINSNHDEYSPAVEDDIKDSRNNIEKEKTSKERSEEEISVPTQISVNILSSPSHDTPLGINDNDEEFVFNDKIVTPGFQVYEGDSSIHYNDKNNSCVYNTLEYVQSNIDGTFK
jgi:hypothetical protein